MKLAQLLNKGDVKVWQENSAMRDFSSIEIASITLNSQLCKPNTLFIAAPGATRDSKDGHSFIREALRLGASALVIENPNLIPNDIYINVPVFISTNSRRLIASWSEQLQGYPSNKLAISGITGTNGKTSSSFFLASILKTAGFRPAVLGTLGAGSPENPHYTGFTTPEAEHLSATLADLSQQGFSHVAMEVSSHALELFRCDAINFAAAAFLNLSQDHLDFHGDMPSYRKAKERLFLELLPNSSPSVVPVLDPLFDTLKKQGKTVLGFGRSTNADIHADQVNLLRSGTQARIRLGTQSRIIEMPVFGDFNLDNVMCAAGLAFAQGVSSEIIFNALSTISAPPGRIERIQPTAKKPAPLVFVDFAHTPDALEKALVTTRAFSDRSLRLVFGCGGNRDRQKRPLMGKVAVNLADEIWITNDNPRHENPQQIFDDICNGIAPSMRHKIKLMPDRALAISEAIKSAHLEDTVLIAGKGHEATQQFGDEYLPFSDQEVARKILEDWRR